MSTLVNAASISANLNCLISASLISGAEQFNFSIQSLFPVLSNGTGAAGKVNQIYAAQRTLTAGSNERIHLYDFAGALDGVGNAFALATIKALVIQNLDVLLETNSLTIGNDNTSAAWTSFLGNQTNTIVLPGGVPANAPAPAYPGGSLVVVAPGATGYAVVNTTNHLLKILNNGSSSVSYNIVVIGSTS